VKKQSSNGRTWDRSYDYDKCHPRSRTLRGKAIIQPGWKLPSIGAPGGEKGAATEKTAWGKIKVSVPEGRLGVSRKEAFYFEKKSA